MNHLTNPVCDRCGELQDAFKKLKVLKIKGEKTYLCRSCYSNNRLRHRAVTKEDYLPIKIIEAKPKEKKKYTPKRYKKKAKEEDFPKIKGSTFGKAKVKSQSYLTLHEKQNLFRILVKQKGLDAEKAKERIQQLVDYEKWLRREIKDEKKTEEQAKETMTKMLEELWNS